LDIPTWCGAMGPFRQSRRAIRLGKAYGDNGQLQRALSPLLESISRLRPLSQADPSRRADLSRSLTSLGFPRLQTGQPDQARPLLEEALGLLQPLAAQNPELRDALIRTQANLRNSLTELERLRR
jgi:hypothetical protein